MFLNNPKMLVNKEEREIDPGQGIAPILVKGRTVIPILSVVEDMGGKVGLDGDKNEITLKSKETEIKMWLDKKEILVNRNIKTMDV